MFTQQQCLNYPLMFYVVIYQSNQIIPAFMDNQSNKDTILTEEVQNVGSTHEEPLLDNPKSKSYKKYLAIGTAILIGMVITMIILITRGSDNIAPIGVPTSIRLALPNGTTIQMGNSRVVQVLFYSGHDDRTADDYQPVTKRNVSWSTNPNGIISVDPYGRIETLAVGTTQLRVDSASNRSAFDIATISVTPKSSTLQMGTKKRIINFNGTKVRPSNLPQKVVTKIASEKITNPSSLQEPATDQNEGNYMVKQGDIVWQIKKYADDSNRSYVLRTNTTADEGDRNKYQYFIGNRYLPGTGTNVVKIEDDQDGTGIWVTDQANEITHIAFIALNSTSKAFKMSKDYEPYLRYGLASGAQKRGNSWGADIDDNDGLWTSMYAVGELMRYSVVKYFGYSDTTIAQSRTSALKSLKAVLMVSNVAARNTIINARIRHFNNTRTGDGTRMSHEFLKAGAVYSVDNFVSNSMDGVGFFGNDAGQTVDQLYYGGKKVYTYLPNQADDWSTNAAADTPATTKRNILGFISRSFGIYGIDEIPTGGLFFKHNPDGTQKVLHDADRLYDYQKWETPTLDLGNLPLPEVLMDVINLNGVQYNKSNLFYKGDTSTDEVVGHIFVYKVAFDILDEDDPEEKKLKELIVSTMVNFCTGLIDNGYSFVDATGQGTTWGKMVRDFMNSDSTIEDAPVKTIEVLMSFKVCAYVTGDDRWEKQYRYLIEDPAFRYLDVVAGVWKRWLWRSFNQDYNAQPFEKRLNSSQQYSDEQIIRHVMMEIHYSDEQEALLAYYLAFQLEQNQEYLAKYREGLEGWWHSLSRSENPLWYFFYQLAYPNQTVQDHFGSNILDVSMWQLERHPVSTIKYVSYIQGSRPDVVCEGVDPTITVDPRKVIQKRKQVQDAQYAERPLNKKTVHDYDPLNLYEIRVLPKDERNMDKFNAATFQHPFNGNANSMEPPTTYTLPYWFGVYHKMIDPQ